MPRRLRWILPCLLAAVAACSESASEESGAGGDQERKPAAKAGKKDGKMNRLAKEKSPYLLQHATNPVDWYPWGKEAFERAKKEDKPIFLSIGYSSCHWCHVMEHESFADQEVADVLNKHFICIKVDREERPDVDEIYMTAVTMLNRGRGGWPLSAWLTPDLKPFFGGTYFPKKDKPGMPPGFLSVLNRIVDLWSDDARRKQIKEQSDEILDHLKQNYQVEGEKVGPGALQHGYEFAASRFDPIHGGFGTAPKFPSPGAIRQLFRWYVHKGQNGALEMAVQTLEKMADGGIHDHVGGGFHRYSTTADWLVPHFEKMLYDNAQLIELYADGYRFTGDPRFADVARDIGRWVRREMTGDHGGFYSAQDADDPGGPEGEGGFYIWDPAELQKLLGEEDAKLFGEYYDVSPQGNWEHRQGKSILQIRVPLEAFAKKLQQEPKELGPKLEGLLHKLYPVREKRPKPMTDTKILVDWNALMISGFCRAHQALGDKEFLDLAVRAGTFIREKMTDKEGRLLRRFREGETAHAGVLDDYAYVIRAYLDLYETTFEQAWLVEAMRLKDVAVELFADPKGGFFMTPAGNTRLIVRSKSGFDQARPSGNGVMGMNLARLYHFTGDTKDRDRAWDTVTYFGARLKTVPLGMSALLDVVDFLRPETREVFIAGPRDDPATRKLIEAVWRNPDRNRVLALVTPELEKLLPTAKGKTPVKGKPAAYVCRNFTCDAPVTDPAFLEMKKRK